jgi:hypothetical protein
MPDSIDWSLVPDYYQSALPSSIPGVYPTLPHCTEFDCELVSPSSTPSRGATWILILVCRSSGAIWFRVLLRDNASCFATAVNSFLTHRATATCARLHFTTTPPHSLPIPHSITPASDNRALVVGQYITRGGCELLRPASSLGPSLWAECTNSIVHCLNRLPVFHSVSAVHHFLSPKGYLQPKSHPSE